ncbi:hypothetical protein MF271_02255 (plasmid) [Deinococcus sp. KNUC1210]|uniref:hypothetical protein n=1 Tax=Deinococcus sp. KNUC1210 TaxID=2917691 RepID=UPI001EF011FB|nr:hypothetical protein [Deinococcus sp. KNUC1210]ULH14124.1 hypothetical protein MF271_02255 [Deinococcus sp. KNUC1210]
MSLFHRSVNRQGAAWLVLLGLVGCGVPAAPTIPSGLQPLGLVEVTVSGLDSPQPHSTARLLPRLGAQSLSEQPGGLQLQPLTTSVFNLGARNAGTGQRYVTATFRVRNADSDGTPSPTSRQNLTLLAVAVPGTQDDTALSSLQTFDGHTLPAGQARRILPTHALQFQPTTASAVLSSGGEDLQVYSEAEVLPGNFTHTSGPVTSYADLGVRTVFPFGYVVRAPAAAAGSARRTLPASPASDQYDGRVAISVTLPLQPDDPTQTPAAGAARDPFSFHMVFLVVADPTTSVTQSLDEQASNAAVLNRASDTAATQINVLPGSTAALGTVQGVTTRRICQVRTAGLVGDTSPAPTFLVNACP